MFSSTAHLPAGSGGVARFAVGVSHIHSNKTDGIRPRSSEVMPLHEACLTGSLSQHQRSNGLLASVQISVPSQVYQEEFKPFMFRYLRRNSVSGTQAPCMNNRKRWHTE